MNKCLLYITFSSLNIFYVGAQEVVKSTSPVAKPTAISSVAKEKSTVAIEGKGKPAFAAIPAIDGKVITAEKILIVDFFEVAGKSSFGQETEKNIREKTDSIGKELQQDERNITQAATDFKAKASTMNDSAREKEELRLKKMQREYAEKRQDYEEEIKTFYQTLMKELDGEFVKAAVNYAQDNNIDVVIDRATGRFLYVADKLNHTSDIVALMDKEHTTKLAQSKQNIPTPKQPTSVASSTTKTVAKAA